MLDFTPALDLLRRLLDTSAVCNDSVLVPERNDDTALATPAAAHTGLAASPSNGSGTTKSTSILVENAEELTYYQFVERYMAPNVPVLIKGACQDWSALRDWTTTDGRINMDYLRQLAGHCKVTVTDTARHHNGSGPCTSMTFDQYCDWWQQHHNNQQQQQPGDGIHNQEIQQQQQQQPLWYLKDWHFVGEFPHMQVYNTPIFFQEDWLNEYYDAKQQQQHICELPQQQQQQQTCEPSEQQQQQQPDGQHQTERLCSNCSSSSAATANAARSGHHSSSSSRSSSSTCDHGASGAHQNSDSVSVSAAVTCDYRFVYCGPAGSWTPVHSDVLRSYSWSANVVGRKRWWLLPPQYTHLLLDQYGETCTDFFGQQEGPAQQQRQQQWQQHLIEVEQGVGEVLFVPSGWHHMVSNQIDTISINHNWNNCYNIHWSWALLKHEHKLATQQLEDCRETATAAEFEGLVQNMLAANSGFNFEQFAEFMITIIDRRLCDVKQQQRQRIQPQIQQAQQQQPLGLEHQQTQQSGLDHPAPAAAQPGQQQQTGPEHSIRPTCNAYHEESQFCRVGSVSSNELGDEQSQVQLLHCLLDISRAADVLQQVQEAYFAAARYNNAWLKRRIKAGVTVARQAASDSTGAQLWEIQQAGQEGLRSRLSELQLPAWMQNAADVARDALDAVQRLNA